MPLLSYSIEAKNDLFETGIYIAERNPAAANKIITKLMHSCENLKDFPLSGVLRDDLKPGVREWVCDNYLIFYRMQNDIVEILRIVHGARYLSDLL